MQLIQKVDLVSLEDYCMVDCPLQKIQDAFFVDTFRLNPWYRKV